MSRFFIACFLVGLTPHVFSMDGEAITEAFRAMYDLADQRDETTSTLKRVADTALAQKAKKIPPEVCEAVPMLQDQTFPSVKVQLLLRRAQKDFTKASMYWAFVKRSLEPYTAFDHTFSEDQQREFLKTFALEIDNFFSFCSHDLVQAPKAVYCNDEFFRTLFIYKKCQELATHWQLDIPPAPEIGKKTHAEIHTLRAAGQVNISEISGGLVVGAPKETSDLGKRFFSDVLFGHTIKRSANVTHLVEQDPVLKHLNAYALIPGESDLETYMASLTHSQKPPKQESKAAPKVKKKPQPKRPQKPKKEAMVEESEPETVQPLEEVKPVKPTPPQPTPVIARVEPRRLPNQKIFFTRPQRFEVQGITWNKTYLPNTQSPTYGFGGTTFTFPMEDTLGNYDLDLLKKIKRLTHLAPKDPEQLPNLATGWVRFHLQDKDGTPQDALIAVDGTFLSGGKYFDERDLSFKRQHNLVNTRQDILTPIQQKEAKKFESFEIGIYVGIAMEQKLRARIMPGGWKDNALDSEALLLLSLEKKMPTYLQQLAAQYPESTIQGVALGVSSYYNPCSNCERLIAGFEHNLPHILWQAKKQAKVEDLHIASNLGSVALVYGHRPGRFATGAVRLSTQQPVLRPGVYSLNCLHAE